MRRAPPGGSLALPLGLLLALLLSACGSRSSLLSEQAGAGAGAAGGAGGGAGAGGGVGGVSAGGGGAGGGVIGSCDVLAVDGPPISPDPAIGGDQQLAPWLATIESDESRSALVYIERTTDVDPFFKKASVALDNPWGAWPSGLGTSAFHGLTDGFVVGSAREGRFSMLTTDEPNNAGDVPTGMVVWAPKAGVSGAEGQFFSDVNPGVPALVTSNGDAYLAGFRLFPGGDLDLLTLSRVVFGAGPVSASDVVACSIQAGLSGAAIPLGGGFLAAFSNGRPYSKCLTDDLPDGPPSRIQIVKMDGKPGAGMLTFENDEPDTYILWAHLTPAGEGAWAAWERIPFEPPFDRRIQLLQLDAAGLPASGKIIDVASGTTATRFAIASLGPLVAIATMASDGIGARTLTVHLLAADGALVAEATLQAAEGFELGPSVALLGSPAGGHLLVAWEELSAIGNNGRRVRLARLACQGP